MKQAEQKAVTDSRTVAGVQEWRKWLKANGTNEMVWPFNAWEAQLTTKGTQAKMTTDKKYNGWTNYETWLVKLWMDNEEGSYNYWIEEAQHVYDDAEASDTFTKVEQAALDLDDILKEQHEEALPKLEGFAADLLNAAMSEVNWHEIAVSLIEDNITEEEEATT